ncbi:hypothetical protein Sango_2484100 [Sesamum angolense]|uniref:Uncharacterized protein n=1 Tax=Sesamum angolense TaxID=2727404 RepID=A0AAE2BI23_9LAMI|nr:hypothetical protein Sango_2484100 [Sesamum angolense]
MKDMQKIIKEHIKLKLIEPGVSAYFPGFWQETMLRKQGSKPAIRVHDSRLVEADSSTACMRPSPESGETKTIESQEVQTPADSSQPSTFEVKEEEINLMSMPNTSKVNTNKLISYSMWSQVPTNLCCSIVVGGSLQTRGFGIPENKSVKEMSGRIKYACISWKIPTGSTMLGTTPNYWMQFFNQTTSLATSKAAMYSASRVESAVVAYLELFQAATPSFSLNTKPN